MRKLKNKTRCKSTEPLLLTSNNLQRPFHMKYKPFPRNIYSFSMQTVKFQIDKIAELFWVFLNGTIIHGKGLAHPRYEEVHI